MKLAKTYPIRLVCRLLDVPRSSVYYSRRHVPVDEAMMKTALLDLAGEWPTYGYRRPTAHDAPTRLASERQTCPPLDARAELARHAAAAQATHLQPCVSALS
jgi:hypothetical protein